ncbi:exopolyphosphatase [Erythrobacter sp. KY5]|uniref:Ppx/GppA phosphatase family protein n=1 Tax=Erythrobacter sp. KY5 TaxID=2011159 RepID=UPI000DBF0088|nr:Ppx/GppA phosphatase family protein [Erythrobacter sp. KY5]AWW75803.1 exopolyphosphatase [Erythrobacter sp. KY5]
MADALPPDENRRAGKRRSGKSGKVADFRYKRSNQQGKGSRQANSRANGGRTNGSTRPDAARGPTRPVQPSKDPHRINSKPRKNEAYAALDLGTNNCRLLIARPSGRDFTVIDAFSRVVKLGEDLAKTGRLSDEAMDRAVGALAICAEKLRRRNVRLARSVATEACRRASNGEEFIERVKRETGIMLDIITAQEEARLAVLGCHILLESGEGPAVIFDIGGGSTELVLLKPGGKIPEIIDWQSVPWGVVSLTDTVGRGEAGRDARIARYTEMRRIVSDAFAPFAGRIADAAKSNDIRLLGTSGTVTTLASLHLELPHYDRKAVDGLIVPSTAMRDISGRLSAMSPSERSELPCIGHDRADLVVAGCAILESILDLWPAERLGVADRGIREGILRSLMAAERQSERSLKALHESRVGRSAEG